MKLILYTVYLFIYFLHKFYFNKITFFDLSIVWLEIGGTAGYNRGPVCPGYSIVNKEPDSLS